MNKYLLYFGNLLFKISPYLYRTLYTRYKYLSDSVEIALMKRRVQEGDCVLDIGANIGFYSGVLSSLVGSRGKVFAFEPESSNYRQLEKYTANLTNVKAVNAAVGSRSGEIELYVSKELNVDHHTYDDGSGREVVKSNIVSIDDYLDPAIKIDFIKMDIQGFELQALKGARRTLTEHGPELLFEFWPFGMRKSGDDPYELIEFLTGLGYSIDYLCEKDLASIDFREAEYGFYFNMHAYKNKV